MIRRTLSVVVLAPLVLAIVVLAPDPLFLVFLDLVLLIGILELFQLLAPVGVRNPFRRSSCACCFPGCGIREEAR